MSSSLEKMKFNEMKYGTIFKNVLLIMVDYDLFQLGSVQTNGNYPIIYLDLCENFMSNFLKEINYHNYFLMLPISDYPSLIRICLKKSIYLKDTKLFKLDPIREIELSTDLLRPLASYIKDMKIQHLKCLSSNQINSELVQTNCLKKINPPTFNMVSLARPPQVHKNGTYSICQNDKDIPF